jgi:hypothetical protein
MEQLSQQRRIAQAREALKKRVEIQRLEQGQENLRREYLTQLRDQKIDEREKDWAARNTEDVIAKVSVHREKENDRIARFRKAQQERVQELREAPRVRAELAEQQRALDRKRQENARERERARLQREVDRLKSWKREIASRVTLSSGAEGPLRSVLAAPKAKAGNPAEAKRAENIALREAQRKERFEENRQLVADLPSTTFTGNTEKALLSGAMSVFWHARSTSAANYDYFDEADERDEREEASYHGADSPLSPS